MYNKNGSFGQVRLASPAANDSLFSLSICGWHRCNDLYRIDRHPDSAALLLYTVDGCGEIEIEGKRFSLPAGSVGYIQKGAMGYYRTPKGGYWEFYWVHPNSKTADLFFGALPHAATAAADPTKEYGKRVEKLLQLCRLQGERAAIELSMHLSELMHLSVLDFLGEEKPPTLAERAREYFDNRLGEPVTVQTAADALFVSPAHLIRIFKKETGQTPHAYLLAARLSYARRLLSLGMSVNETAVSAGFCSSSHFISAFRTAFGLTPTQYLKINDPAQE